MNLPCEKPFREARLPYVKWLPLDSFASDQSTDHLLPMFYPGWT